MPLSSFTLLQESFMSWWCSKIQIWVQAYSQRLPKSNLACRSVKKFKPIIPPADVGNMQTKNEWLKVTPPIWNKTWCSPTISHYSESFECRTFERYLRHPWL
jgi:hypothetical protein